MPSLSALNLGASRQSLSAQELADQLRQAVERGMFERGERMPTIRQVTEETGLTYNLVNRAFAILQNEGLLVSRKRAGTFVAEDPASRVAERRREQQDSRIRVFALVGPELHAGFYPTLLKGLGAAAGKAGYQIIASDTQGDVGIQADTIMQLIDKSVAGVALVPATLGAPPVHHINLLQKAGIPVVFLHRGIEGVSAPQIVIPAEQVGRRAAQELVDRGHTRIGFCASQRSGSAIGYEQGFRDVLAEASLDLPESCVLNCDMKIHNKEEYIKGEAKMAFWFDQIMASDERPSAIFTSFEPLGEILYLLAIRRGLRVPEDLSIVTVGGRERHGAVARRLACVALDEFYVGELAAELLGQMTTADRKIDGAEVFTIRFDFDPAESVQ